MIDYRVGDSRTITAGIPDGSVDLVASSPPFLALRSYLPVGHEAKGDEIGSETNPAAFIDTLLELTAEWGRVLAPHGSIAIELGDTYSGSGGSGGDYNEGGFRDGQAKVNGSASRNGNDLGHASKDRWASSDNRPGWPRAKCLALIPQLYAVALAYGINPLTGQPSPAGRWLVRNVIVWHRPNPAVGALGDKVRPSTSYIVVATRSAKRWFDLTAVRGESVRGPRPSESNGTENRLKSSGGSRPSVRGSMSNPEWASSPPLDCWFDEYDFHDTWTLTTQPSSLAHYAMWPAKLAERLILMMCPREVCRVCGEPRRRVETRLRMVNGDPERARVAPTRNDAGGSVATGQRNNFSTDVETIGWTECIHSGSAAVGGSNVTDYRSGLVLDPFAGTGTTLAVADLHGRDAIGIDIDERNRDIYPRRYDEVKRALFGTPAPMPGQGDLFAEEVPA